MSNEMIQSQLDEAGEQITDLKNRLCLQEKNLEERDKKIEILSKQVGELQAFISGMCLAKVNMPMNGIIREVLVFVLNPETQIIIQPQAEVKPPPFTIVDP